MSLISLIPSINLQTITFFTSNPFGTVQCSAVQCTFLTTADFISEDGGFMEAATFQFRVSLFFSFTIHFVIRIKMKKNFIIIDMIDCHYQLGDILQYNVYE